jgi:hypothetical protein
MNPRKLRRASAVALAGLLVACFHVSGAGQTQEKPVPKDSTRITVSGCLKGKSLLIAIPRPGAEPVSGPLDRGSRLRLIGKKELLNEIRGHKDYLVEITGLAKISSLSPANQGIPIGMGGKIRLGGGPPNRDPTQSDPLRDPLANEIVLDTEAWKPLPEACPNLDK